MKKVIIIMFVIITNNLIAQNVLLTQYPMEDTIIPKYGQNLKNFGLVFINYELYVDNFSNNSSKIKHGSSYSLTCGYKYKRKVSNFWSLGYEVFLKNSTFNIVQNNDKIFPTSTKFKNERLSVGGIGIGLYTRFNFDRRGNKIGKYIELGGYASWNYANNHFMKYKTVVADSSNAKIIRITETNLNYFQKYEYGIKATLGSNHLSINATYRLSDLIIKKLYFYPEVPKISIGFGIGVY